jgi:hypothetical protein
VTDSTWWTVSVMVEVRSPGALHAAAVADYENANGPDADASHFGTAEEPDIGACLRQFIDPGGLEGCKVIDSVADEN